MAKLAKRARENEEVSGTVRPYRPSFGLWWWAGRSSSLWRTAWGGSEEAKLGLTAIMRPTINCTN